MAKFRVWFPDREDRDDAKEVEASSHGRAAEICAERRDRGDYSIAQLGAVACVAAVGSDDEQEFDVHAESVPEYYATKKKAA